MILGYVLMCAFECVHTWADPKLGFIHNLIKRRYSLKDKKSDHYQSGLWAKSTNFKS